MPICQGSDAMWLTEESLDAKLEVPKTNAQLNIILGTFICLYLKRNLHRCGFDTSK